MVWHKIKKWFTGEEPTVNGQITDTTTQQPVAQPVVQPIPCGCGRSPTGNCVGLHKLTDEQWAVSDKNPNKVPEVPEVVEAPKVEKPKTTVKKTTSKTKKSAAKK